MHPNTIYIHIGMPKTGTTALQQACYANRQQLKDLGFLYPQTGLYSVAHHLLGYSLWTRNVRWMKTDKSDPRGLIEAMLREADATQCRNLLVSSELLMFAAREGTLDLLRNCLAGFEIRIICYVRRMDGYISSAIAQTIKSMGGIFRISDFNQGKPVPQIDKFMQDEPGYLAQWLDAFPPDTMTVRPYERQQLHGGDICADFWQTLGIEDTSRLVAPIGNPNPRMTWDALEFKRLVNIVLVEEPQAAECFTDPLLAYSGQVEKDTTIAFGDQTGLISPARRRAAIDGCTELYARIAREYLGRADGKLFYAPLPDPHEPWTPYPGLSTNAVAEITNYLDRHYPQLLGLLRERLAKSAATSTLLGEAVELLSPHLPCNVRFSLPKVLRRLVGRR